MTEYTGDIWDCWSHDGSPICITTNGVCGKNGAVMGRGTAFQAKMKFPDFPIFLANRLKQEGNVVHYFRKFNIFTFPVKKRWDEKAEISIIRDSAIRLVHMADLMDLPAIYLPRPGCGNGGLDWWNEVRPILDSLFDGRFIIINK